MKLALACLALAAGAAEPPRTQTVELQIRNVQMRLSRDIKLEVRSLRGRLKPTKPDRPVTFDDGTSYNVEIDQGEVAMTAASLTALMNSYVFAYEGAPIKNIEVTVKGNKLIQKGTLRKGPGIPFEIEGTVSASPDGGIRMHAEKIKSKGIPVKGVLHLFGADLEKLMHDNAGRGVNVDGDDLILSPRGVTPPPHMEGKVTRVEIRDGKLVQVFDSGRRPPALKPPYASNAYLYQKGGVLRFGKLLMEDADLQIVGDRKSGFFDFFLKEYKKQLVAGYSKTTEANGLVAHFVDYSVFDRAPVTTSSAAQ